MSSGFLWIKFGIQLLKIELIGLAWPGRTIEDIARMLGLGIPLFLGWAGHSLAL
ncbi:hypothetical protein CPB84DRAFT_1761457 [Gymnopilus junonius]|uniref:Uncharacterized protein n=1 Tax=Gymnopilus junonius TaxID=109634 RepID=A0A9P5NXT9_GYMJU|nr:hypothetical protein CPB84DRAFT_1761457 [Gymnopilus junonius]